MGLELIYGVAGGGKTEKCIEEIERVLKTDADINAVLIVPDQYSYTSEKRLTERLGGAGLNGAEVLTFSQLFRRFLHNGKNYLSPSGKEMLFYTAVSSQDGESVFGGSAGKPGFVGKVSQLAEEMKRYLVTPDMLRETAGEKEGILFDKLRAFADIYEAYEALLGTGFQDSDDDFQRLAEFIGMGSEFKNTHIWFDEFSDFMPQHYSVITAFLKNAPSVHISLCMGDNRDGVFKTTLDTSKRLINICKREGISCKETFTDEPCRTILSEPLLHLMENWDKRRKVYEDKTEDIILFCGRDLYSETENIAKEIIKEVKNGARFRDIGVLCTDLSQYSHLIEAVFGDYKIPYYIDDKQSITQHPVILTLLSAFDITEDNWSYESVFKYLRTGFVYYKDGEKIKPIDREKTDRLENYVLRQGIRGKSRWLSEEDWLVKNAGIFDEVIGERIYPKEDEEEINALRKIITEPFRKFYNNVSGKRTVRELCQGLFGFLCDIHLYEAIGIEAGILNESGRRDEAERMKEIWNLLMDVINQAAVALGDKFISRENFREMIRAGLSKAQMQIIPPGVDCISVGDTGRNSFTRIDCLFFLGAVSGTLPNEIHSQGIMSENEREKLSQMGIELTCMGEKREEQENFKLYKMITSASRKLYFSYPSSDAEGTPKQPSAFVKDLHRMFPNMKITDDILKAEEEIISKKQAYLYVMSAISHKEKRSGAEKVLRYYKNDEEFKDKIRLFEYAGDYRNVQPQITKESAELLYNNYHRYSVSRLNDYSMCPFGYFVKHGLKAKEQETWQIKKFEIGSLLHWAVMEYCLEVEDGENDFSKVREQWQNLSDEENNRIIDRIMKDISARVLVRLSRNRGKVEYLLERMKKILARSVNVVRLSLSRGEYAAVCYEQKFSIDVEWKDKKIGLNGTIDRVDACTEEGRIFLRVIDYKSGSKDFDVISIANNTDMQLVVYAFASVELYKKGAMGRAEAGLSPSVSGMLYNKLRNDMVSVDNKEKAEGAIKNNMRLDGPVITEEDELSEAVRMDKSLKVPGTKSEFLKLAVNSGGTALDKRGSNSEARDKFDVLVNYMKKTVVRLDDEIFKGKISISPFGGKKSGACSLCEFKDVCLYDIKRDEARREISKKDEAWKHMEEETAE